MPEKLQRLTVTVLDDERRIPPPSPLAVLNSKVLFVAHRVHSTQWMPPPSSPAWLPSKSELWGGKGGAGRAQACQQEEASCEMVTMIPWGWDTMHTAAVEVRAAGRDRGSRVSPSPSCHEVGV